MKYCDNKVVNVNVEFGDGRKILDRLIDCEYMGYMYSKEWANIEDKTTKEFYRTIRESINSYSLIDRIGSLNNEIINEVSSVCYKKGFETAIKFCKELDEIKNNSADETFINNSSDENILNAIKEIEKGKEIIEELYCLCKKKIEIIDYFKEVDLLNIREIDYLKQDYSYLKDKFIKVEKSLFKIESSINRIK